MTAAPHIPLISIADYLAGELESDIKHEYLGGRVYAMAGGKNVHNDVASNFLVALGSRLRGKPCRPCNSDTKVRVEMPSHTRFYYPDAMVVCDPNPPDETFHDRPKVIVEVLSDSTRRTDEGEKRDAYLTLPSLRVYLRVDTHRARVAVDRRGEQGVQPEWYEGLSAVIPLVEVGAELPLAELYERIDFTNVESSEAEGR